MMQEDLEEEDEEDEEEDIEGAGAGDDQVGTSGEAAGRLFGVCSRDAHHASPPRRGGTLFEQCDGRWMR